MAMLCLFFKAEAQVKKIAIKGRITNEKGLPITNATIKVKDSKTTTLANGEGLFELHNIQLGATLIISSIGYKTTEIQNLQKVDFLNVRMPIEDNKLEEVQIVSTGYQNIPKERATGSFVQIDNKLLNRSNSTDILSRLNGVASGLISTTPNFNNYYQGDVDFRQPNQSGIEIHGRSTLFGNSDPLIVIDNFPYDGNINNINPNDIDQISILKDAAAASAWGVRSGNGVIVITTKKGRLNEKAKISLNVNTTIGRKPDLFYLPQLSSSEYIEVEQYLFEQGAYNSSINNTYSPLSPAINIFLAKRNGLISSSDSLNQINLLKGYDVREQLSKYYYRSLINQQYQSSISGGGTNQKYFISGGYDRNLPSTEGKSYNRVTLNVSNTYLLLKNKLEIFSNILYTNSITKTSPSITSLYPYQQLADLNGNPLAIDRVVRQSYAIGTGNGKLLNWLYKPLEELQNGYSTYSVGLSDYKLNLALNYSIIKSLKASALYSYEKGISDGSTLDEIESFKARNYINSYTQLDPSTNALSYPVPMGGLLSNTISQSRSHNGRIQLDYNNTFRKHSISAIVGSEIKDYSINNSTIQYYGYNPETGSNQNSTVNYTAEYNNIMGSGSAKIPSNTSRGGITNRYLSYYFNGSYIYSDKYIASISVRRDESNLFGVSTNQKGVPLWSAGLAWNATKEDFMHFDWISLLKLRMTYGLTGNVDNSLSAYLTSDASSGFIGKFNAPYAAIVNTSNPSLRWEKNKNFNLGLDYGLITNKLTGSIEFYKKKGVDLIGNSPIAPQTGISLFRGNTATTKTNGFDLQINSINLNGNFKWSTTLLYNHIVNEVTEYKVSNGTNLNVVTGNYNNPLKGYPYYSVFSFKYAGLNSTGDPQGYLNGVLSTDYSAITNSTNRDDLEFIGSATPTSFGNLRNDFSYKGFVLSVNISYKYGYYFRRKAVTSSSVYGGLFNFSDYQDRWQMIGDESKTDIPRFVYPQNNARDDLYNYSNKLVEKGDHIRLQDIRLGFTVPNTKRLPFSNLNVYTYVNNIGIIWRANKFRIDPDSRYLFPSVRTFSFGIKADF